MGLSNKPGRRRAAGRLPGASCPKAQGRESSQNGDDDSSRRHINTIISSHTIMPSKHNMRAKRPILRAQSPSIQSLRKHLVALEEEVRVLRQRVETNSVGIEAAFRMSNVNSTNINDYFSFLYSLKNNTTPCFREQMRRDTLSLTQLTSKEREETLDGIYNLESKRLDGAFLLMVEGTGSKKVPPRLTIRLRRAGVF